MKSIVVDEIQFNKGGRMKYNPEFHPNHKKPFTESDLEYLCKFVEVDGWRSMAFALGKTESTIMAKISYLKKKGLYDYYKNLNKHW